MRGRKQAQRQFVAMIDVNARIPRGHPIREIKRLSDEVFGRLGERFEAMYSDIGRPSIPPERLLSRPALDGAFQRALRAGLLRTVALRFAVPMVSGPGTRGRTLRCEHLQQEPTTALRTPSGRRILGRSGQRAQGAGPAE